MKQIYSFFIALVMTFQLSAQCTPGNANSCPDPEGNGEICPKVLPIGYVGTAYSQEVTILPPPTTTVGTTTISLHKIRVVSIDNLPPGLSFVSNAVNNDFLIGTYYCFLLSGTPTTPGHYPLNIHVDAYALIVGNPTLLGSTIDSISLFIDIDPLGIEQMKTLGLMKATASPNPFIQACEISFYSSDAQSLNVFVYNAGGQLVKNEKFSANQGLNTWVLTGADMTAGVYHYSIQNSKGMLKGMVLKQ